MANNHRCFAINSRHFAMLNGYKTLKVNAVNAWDALLRLTRKIHLFTTGKSQGTMRLANCQAGRQTVCHERSRNLCKYKSTFGGFLYNFCLILVLFHSSLGFI